jgi:trimethylamine:corrinoid methyltransferase-like protein
VLAYQIPQDTVYDALEKAPKTVLLGARNPDNALVLNGKEPRVYLVTGSETNIWLGWGICFLMPNR